VSRRFVFTSAVTAAAAALAWIFFRTGYPGVIFDAFHYFTLSSIVSVEGLGNLSSRVRMYGYPLFISLVTGFSNPPPGVARAIVAVAQTIVHVAAALYVARVTERIFLARTRTPRAFAGTYALLALNPIALIRATELLTDSLSAVLVGLALYVSLEEGDPTRRAGLAFLAAGFSVAVRPANVVILPALAIVWLLRTRLYREGRRLAGSLALGALCVAATLAPQLYGNVRAWHAWTPLLVDRLYDMQVSLGTGMLKYGTVVIPGKRPQLVYSNPFRPEGVSRPAEFWRTAPLGYIKTLGAHGFAMIDHDYPFTYIDSPPPPWRWPLALANYAFFYLSAVGLVLILVRERGTAVGLYGAGATLFSAALVAIYLPVAVESRFSMPLYILLPPAAIYALSWLSRRRSGTILVVAIAGGGFVAACVQLSLWLSKQASGIEFPP
jgi:hypothetical protein